MMGYYVRIIAYKKGKLDKTKGWGCPLKVYQKAKHRIIGSLPPEYKMLATFPDGSTEIFYGKGQGILERILLHMGINYDHHETSRII